MSWADYDIVGSYNNQRFTNIDAERTINMFEYIDTQGKKSKTLIGTSGLIDEQVIFPNIGAGGFRAQFVFGNNMYVVIGSNVYKLDSSLVAVQINSSTTQITGTTGYVGVDANTYQIIFVDGTKGWIYDTLTGIFVQITDPGFPANPIDVTYLDGFFIVAHGGTNEFQLSSFNNGLIWSAGSNSIAWTNGSANLTITGIFTNYPIGTPVVFNTPGAVPTPLVAGTTYYVVSVTFLTGPDRTVLTVSATPGGSAIVITQAGSGSTTISNNGQLQLGTITSHPGTIQACRTLHRRLFLFAENFTEVWENAGIGTNLPFRRNNSLLIEYGTPSRASVEVGFDTMFFLSQDKDGQGAVMEVAGTQAFPVSNRALDFQIAQYAAAGQVSDADSILIKENGIIFYRLNFTAANHTYVYNLSMSDPSTEEGRRWHEEQVLNGDRHPAQTHGYFFGNNYYGHFSTHILYKVDPNETLNAGEVIPRIRIGKSITSPEYKRLRIDRFHLDVIQGQLNTQLYTETFTVTSPPTVILNVADNSQFVTGTAVTVSTEAGVLPQPLAPFTTYYVILAGSNIKLATTFANAMANTPITLTTTGTPPNSINLTEVLDTNPVIFLSYSKDGGVTYGNRLVGNMGKTGERTTRTVWRKLGTVPRGQGFVPKLEFYNQVPFVVLGAAWVFEVMPE